MNAFLQNLGPILALLGASLAAIVPGIASAKSVGRIGQAASGVIAEDPDKFGKLLILQALPGTQGIYGLLSWFIVMNSAGFLAGNFEMTITKGALFFLASLPIIIVGYSSSILQGKVCEAGVSLVAKRPAEQAKSIVMAAMVETYAILALLATVLSVLNVAKM